MMSLTEKVSYIKGLAEGLELEDSKESKLIKAIIDALDDIAFEVSDLSDTVAEMGEQLDEVDEDLSNLEEDYYDEYDDDDEDDEDDAEYEVTCPACNETFYMDEATLLDGGIDCPNCGEELEFEFDCAEDCEGCQGCDNEEE